MELTAENLLDSIIESSEATINMVQKMGLTARLNQMLTAGTGTAMALSAAIMNFSTDVRSKATIMELMDAVKTNKGLIEAAPNQAAVDAIDFPLINEATSVEVNLDNHGSINPPSPWTTDAAGGDYLFIDTAAQENNVIINNFGNGDRIKLETVFQNQISVSSYGSDVLITNNHEGTISEITLAGIVDPNKIIHDAQSLENTLGYDVFTYA